MAVGSKTPAAGAPTAAPEVSVVIASRNRKAMLADCLQSLIDTTKDTTYEITVVDDAATDGTAELIRERFPRVQVLSNKRRYFWPVTNNQGVQASRGQFYLLINDDTKVLPGAVDALVRFIKANPRVGIVSPRIRNVDGSIQPCARRFPNWGTALAQTFDLHRLFPKNRLTRSYYAADLDYTQANQVEAIASTYWLLRKECYEEVGGFDNSFPPIFSDIEFCMGMDKRGWECWIIPEAEIIHYGGATMWALTLRQLWEYHLGGYLIYHKHYAPRYNPLVNAFAYVGITGRLIIKSLMRITFIDRLILKLPQPHRRRQEKPE